jgi:lipopolysaccharide transport system ATP-binding protein
MIQMQESAQHVALPDDVVLSVRNVSKKFCRNLRRSMAYGIKDLACNLAGLKQDTTAIRKHEFWALKDINLELRKSEFLGIIGANGSGKSTLLRLVHGIFPPDEGEIRMRGRVGALIALGAGFHPHFTGRENIYLNGSILGMNRAFINSRLKRIVEFAEIGDFLDAPVSTYSSGMRVRLGFSVAAHMNPDILLVDEVLSVGDASFRERCYNHMTDYKENGGTVIFISHNTLAVEQICDRVMWLDHGSLVQEGPSHDVVEAYEERMLKQSLQSSLRLESAEEQSLADDVMQIVGVKYLGADGLAHDAFRSGDPIAICLEYQARRALDSAYFGIRIRKGFSTATPSIAACNMLWDGVRLSNLSGRGQVTCLIDNANWTSGAYSVEAYVQNAVSGKLGEKYWFRPRIMGGFQILAEGLSERFPGAAALHVVNGMPALIADHKWSLDGRPLAPTRDG